MESQSIIEEQRDSDEISIVDIISVLIKRRRIVIACTVMGLALGLWFYLGDISRSDKPLYTATLDAFFYDPVVKNPKAVIENFIRGDQFKAALRASSNVDPATLSVSYNEAKLILTIEVQARDKVQSLEAPAQALRALKASYALVEVRKSALALTLLNGSTDGISELRSSISLDSPPFELNALGETRVSAPAAEWLKKAILGLVACIFAGLLFAFLAEGIARMRADPEASKKLRDAWGRRG